MSYVLLDDKFHSNEKTLEVGNVGAGLFARALSYCGDHLTDGFVPFSWAREAGTPKTRKALLDAGLWIEVQPGASFDYVSGDETYTVTIRKPGYFIPDFLALNPTAASVKEKREELSQKRSEAGRKGAMKRWQRDSKQDGKTDGKTMATGKQTDGPQPLPLQENPNGFSHIVDSWLGHAPPLIQHRDSIRKSASAQRAVAKAVKAYGLDDVVQAIANYAQVLGSPAHFFEYRWTLPDFLTRGVHRFVAEAQPLDNFRSRTAGRDRGVTVNDIFQILDGGNDEPRALPRGRVA